MVTRGMTYARWQQLTPEQQWDTFNDLQEAWQDLQDEMRQSVHIRLTVDAEHESQRRAIFTLARMLNGEKGGDVDG